MKPREAGFTLVEVIVAIIILSIITVAFLQLYNGNLFAILTSGKRTEAVYEIQDSLEDILAKAPEEIPVVANEGSLNILFPTDGGNIDLRVDGYFVRQESSGENKVSATIFIPKPTEN